MSLTITRDLDFFDLYCGRPTQVANQIKISSIDTDTSIEVVRKLIAQTPGFSWGSCLSTWFDRTFLHVAAIKNNLRLIYKIVEEGGTALLELGEGYGDATPIGCAAAENNYEAAQALIELGGKVNVFYRHSKYNQISVLEAALSLHWEFDPIKGMYIENYRMGYRLCKLLVNNGARIQESSPLAQQAEAFLKEFSTEITTTYGKCEEISVIFRQIFPEVNGDFISGLRKIIVEYAFGPGDEGPAYDFIRVEALTQRRMRCISESPIAQLAEAFFLKLSITQREECRIGPTLNGFVSRIVGLILAYDEGESYKEAHRIKRP